MEIVNAMPKRGEFLLGLEQYGRKRFEDTELVIMGVPKANGEYMHGLTDAEKKMVEDYFGHKLNPRDAVATEFWDSYMVKINNTVDVTPNREEAILKRGIMTKMGYLARSVEESEKPNNNAIYVIKNDEEVEERKVIKYEQIAKATVRFDELRKNEKLTRAIASLLLPSNIAFNKNLNVVAKMFEYLDGLYVQGKDKEAAAENFLSLADTDKETLYVRADVKKAIHTGIIRRDPISKAYVNKMTGAEYGNDEDSVVAYLLQPKNIAELGDGTAKQAKEAPTTVRAQLLNL